jgi:hypothetical protein
MNPLFHHCFEIEQIYEGDLVPVGGGMIGSKAMPWKVRVNFDQFYPKFAALVEKNQPQFKNVAWQKWLKNASPTVDVGLLTTLQTFTAAFEPKRKAMQNNEHQRKQQYDTAPENCIPLSEMFKSNNAMCVEIALLAKRFLDEKGIRSRFFSGEFMHSYTAGEINVPEPHAFLIIEHQGKEYIFDPTQPTQLQNNRMVFSLFEPCASFALRREELQNDCLMIAAKNVLTKDCRYYGVGDHGNVPESLILHGTRSTKMQEQPSTDQTVAAPASTML